MQDEGIQRCSTSTDSRIGESGPENSSDEEDIEVKRPDLHNVDIEDGQTDDDDDVMLSRKPSESSGYAGSDLYDYKVCSFHLIPLPYTSMSDSFPFVFFPLTISY